MKAITIDELHRIWLPIITLSWVTPEFGPSTLQWQNAKPAIPLKRWCVKQTCVKWIDWLRHSTSPGQRGCYQHCTIPLSASQSSRAGVERVVKTEEGSFVPGFSCSCYSWCCSSINIGSGSKSGSFQSPLKCQWHMMLHPNCTKSWIQRRDEK